MLLYHFNAVEAVCEAEVLRLLLLADAIWNRSRATHGDDLVLNRQLKRWVTNTAFSDLVSRARLDTSGPTWMVVRHYIHEIRTFILDKVIPVTTRCYICKSIQNLHKLLCMLRYGLVP
jgi:acyl-ACP thioesterase